MTVKKRLVQFLKYKGLSQKKFAEKIGLSAGYVNAIRASIRPITMERITGVFPELSEEWVLSGKGEMLKAVPKENIKENRKEVVTESTKEETKANIKESPKVISKGESLMHEIELLKAQIRELEGENNRLKGKNEANEYTVKVLMKQFGINYKQTTP